MGEHTGEATYPAFCSYRGGDGMDDPYFAAVAEMFGHGGNRLGLALGANNDRIEVLVTVDGRTMVLSAPMVRLGLSEDVALGLMDAVEEAIEDAIDADAASSRVVRLEQTLALMERCLADE